MKKKFFIAVFVLFAIFATFCEKKNLKAFSNGGVNVVATVFPLYDFARAAAKEHANITMLVPPGSSAHSFEPSPADIKNIQSADVFLYIGGESDAWAERILGALDTSKIKIVRLFDFVKLHEEEKKEGMQIEREEKKNYGGEYDEHIWTSPKNAALMIDAITKALCEKNLSNCETYKENSKSYISQIDDLSNELSQIVVSAKRKQIVVADRFPFRYLTEELELDYVAAFPGHFEHPDASAATIAFLIDTVIKNRNQYIFHAELSDQSAAKTVSWQTGTKILMLHSCHNVSDQDFEDGITYLDLMKQNAENLKLGLYY